MKIKISKQTPLKQQQQQQQLKQKVSVAKHSFARKKYTARQNIRGVGHMCMPF
jgi:hypothetical protein